MYLRRRFHASASDKSPGPGAWFAIQIVITRTPVLMTLNIVLIIELF